MKDVSIVNHDALHATQRFRDASNTLRAVRKHRTSMSVWELFKAAVSVTRVFDFDISATEVIAEELIKVTNE